jgi:hypothetical protein
MDRRGVLSELASALAYRVRAATSPYPSPRQRRVGPKVPACIRFGRQTVDIHGDVRRSTTLAPAIRRWPI